MLELLLAEDNPADVYLIREALRENGVDCRLRVAADGKEVLTILSEEVPGESALSLIILDLNLPFHDGIEILEKLRELGLDYIPVIVLTSSDELLKERNNVLPAVIPIRVFFSVSCFPGLLEAGNQRVLEASFCL